MKLSLRLAATLGVSVAACGVVVQRGLGDAAPRQNDATTSASPGDGDAGGLDGGTDAGHRGVPPTSGAVADAEAVRDAFLCDPGFDAKVETADGSLCLGGGNCEPGGIPCCPGYGCVPCAVVVGDGSYVLSVEAGPFYCNVEHR